MSTTVTNQTLASALRGQNVVVTLNAADAANVTSTLVGHTCSVGSSGKTGRVAEVFFGGVQFLIAPNNFGSRFDSSSTPGQLAAAESITIN